MEYHGHPVAGEITPPDLLTLRVQGSDKGAEGADEGPAPETRRRQADRAAPQRLLHLPGGG